MKRWVVITGFFFVLGAAPAHGAPPAKPSRQPSAESAPPPDLVILKSGGMLRGTISELDPNNRVVIVLVTGEVRTIEMDQVEYAGPASKAPQAGSKKAEKERRVTEIEEALVEGDYEVEDQKGGPPRRRGASQGARSTDGSAAARVSFVSREPGLKVHLHVGSGEVSVNFQSVTVDAYQTLCTTPCTVELEPGSYRFGVSTDGKDPAGADDFVEVVNGATVEVEHRSHSGTRAAGWLTMIGSTIVGGVLMWTALPDCEVDDESCEGINTTQMLAGLGVALVGSTVGYLLTMKKDEAGAGVAVSAAAMPSLAWHGAPGGRVAGSPSAGALDVLPAMAITGTF